jgi:hypothetical protein
MCRIIAARAAMSLLTMSAPVANSTALGRLAVATAALLLTITTARPDCLQADNRSSPPKSWYG